MAAGAAAIGAYLNLVGPLSTAVTQLVSLWNEFPTVSNQPGGADPASIQPHNVVNIGVGFYEGGAQTNFGGDGLSVNTFTTQGTYISSGVSPPLKQGQTFGVPLDASKSSVGDVQAWQLTLSSTGADAVCVQYVELGWQGTITSGFDGTWGKDCGQDWFYSASTWGFIEQANPSGPPTWVAYRPACWWMDNVSKENTKQQHPNREVWVNMESLLSGAPAGGSNTSTSTYCNQNVMRFSATTAAPGIAAVPDGLNQDIQGNGPPAAASSSSPTPKLARRRFPRDPGRKRIVDLESYNSTINNTTDFTNSSSGSIETNVTQIDVSTGNTTMSQLVVSDIEVHSAQELCDHPRSRGPDFVSTMENLFCDMSAKKIYPLCAGNVTTACFVLDEPGHKLRKRGQSMADQDDALHRSYGAVNHWTT